VRIHLGHHFYGAGNLGDDFMLAGFLGEMRQRLPDATFTSCVPFPLAPLQSRFPAIEWRAYDDGTRDRSISECDLWLGLGGSPFQHALSRWFLDHLHGEAARCRRQRKPMFFLGIGVQSAGELAASDVARICEQAAGIWTRDASSAERIRGGTRSTAVQSGADVAHLFFRASAPPAAKEGRCTVVANFDYGSWPGQDACLLAIDAIKPRERVWLAQESRELPGAERALHASLPPVERARWKLIVPDVAGAPLKDVLEAWPGGEWLVTSRYHAALAGAWAGSKIVVIGTNEKLASVARELDCPQIAPTANESQTKHALQMARPTAAPIASAERAAAMCSDFVRSAVAALG
jgi:polysaccharide pyruvyl transferase WcaK-like protein